VQGDCRQFVLLTCSDLLFSLGDSTMSINSILDSIPSVHTTAPVRVTYQSNPLKSSCIGMFKVYENNHFSKPSDQVFLTFITLTAEMITALKNQLDEGAKEGQISVSMQCHDNPKLSASGQYKIALKGKATVLPPKPAIQERAEDAQSMATDFKG
jgi:hypothetical protein